MSEEKSFFSSFIPLLLLVVLVGFLWWGLFHHKENELPSALIGQHVPEFSLPDIYQPNKNFTNKDFLGHVSLLNVWATWCYACRLEHPMLMEIQSVYQVPIFSIVYKDQPTAAKKWLSELGNPFVMSGNDQDGAVSIDFGVYGTPETYIIDGSGIVRYRHIGSIDKETWEQVMWPIVQKYRKG